MAGLALEAVGAAAWGTPLLRPNSVALGREVVLADPSAKLQAVIRHRRRCVMIARGRVQNGVVVLADGVRLAEGQEMTVLAPTPAGPGAHGILDIPPVSVGSVIRPLTPEDDLLGEMLEGRP